MNYPDFLTFKKKYPGRYDADPRIFKLDFKKNRVNMDA